MYIDDLEYQNILEKMPILCVDLVIVHDNRCLLLFRNNEPAKDQWWFPGGRLHKMELIRDAAIRKAKEETNLNCVFEKILSIEETIFPKNQNMNIDLHTVNICCYLKVDDDIKNLQIDKHHSDYMWISEESEIYHKSVNYPISLLKLKI